ncbi:hypothetical protein NMG60_11027953 [Bertholletia excelsa]
MSNRIKEEERIEKVIRSLLKLPENRRCINCNNLGPQYVCTTFWTFVCTNCSGIHREFTHRVKSVSMAKFTAEEANALQAGGNERAREIYLKEWDPQLHSFPDSRSQSRLRDFIKNVYVDKKFTGERSAGKLGKLKTGAKEDSSEQHSIWKPRTYYAKVCQEDSYKQCSLERSSTGSRSFDRGSKYYVDERNPHRPSSARAYCQRRTSIYFEVVDDRFRDDEIGSARRHSHESTSGIRSPKSQKSRGDTTLPVVHHVRDILGENVLHLQVGESPKPIDWRDNNSSAHCQKTAPFNDPGSVDGKSLEAKKVNSDISVYFSARQQPPNPAAAVQTQQTALPTDDGKGAAVQSSTEAKISDAPKVNPLEFLLFELSAPAAVPANSFSEVPDHVSAPSDATVALADSIAAAITTSKANSLAAPSSGSTPVSPAGVTDRLQLSITQQTPSYCLILSWTLSFGPNSQVSTSASAEESNQTSSIAGQDSMCAVGSEASLVEAKSCGKKELPVGLFTSSYSSFPAPVQSWQFHPPYGMEYGMQYNHTSASKPAFTNSQKSRNPFDLDDDNSQAQVPMVSHSDSYFAVLCLHLEK